MTNRNEPCPCGSGRRYKHCHGLLHAVATAPAGEAQAAHRAGSLDRAEALYRQALADNPGDVDARHMLGVVQFERMRYAAALDHLWHAAEQSGWGDADIRHNLGLTLAKLMSPDANARQEALVSGYLARERECIALPPILARVSVVLPVHNAAESVTHTIESVATQGYPDVELIVVDDGSTDETESVVAECIAGLAVASRLIRRSHRGAAQAANDGADLASGRFLAFLAAGDRFASCRIERMVSEIARDIPLWGWSRWQAAGSRADGGGDAATATTGAVAEPGDDEPMSFKLLSHDVAGSSGNLFFDRELFRSSGGFRDIAHHRGWDLCVRVAEVVEPVMVAEPLYFCGEPRHRGASPADIRDANARRARGLLLDALTRDAGVANALCPQFVGNRELLLRSELRSGRGEHVPIDMLRALAAKWRAQLNATSTRDVEPPRRPSNASALVVLGVYRSGTSALARALNLCGAHLPQRITPARLGVNPTGFWESEAVNDLDARLLHHLGADWNSVHFELPQEGTLVQEFLTDLRTLLAKEYGDAGLILVKDPRVCVLAPLWQRALLASGYRPLYVVPVRHPLEVAQSLQSRGEMPVAQGLALWLAYMQRVYAFSEGEGVNAIYVRYTDLLDDWRNVIGRIAKRFGLPLAIEACEAELDSFLDPGLRRQRAEGGATNPPLAGEQREAVDALYRRLLACCERDAVEGGSVRSSRAIPH